MGVVVFGAQWGDEGKGKVISHLSGKFDAVVRFHGGSNAGHTVVKNGITTKLSLIPCGILEKRVQCILGSGVVLDMPFLIGELSYLRAKDIDSKNLYLADNMSVVLPIHKELDALMESKRENEKIGTTVRGIGPCYEDRVGRVAVRLCDMKDIDRAIECLEYKYRHMFPGNFDKIIEKTENEIREYSSQMIPYMIDSVDILDICSSKKVLFEGAQGYWLDVYHGTYPYVTSSCTMPAQACSGSPTSIKAIECVIGVAKAYSTRVGNGVMPTEQSDVIGSKMLEVGAEFGTVTRRMRRCGWFDAVMTRQALRMSGADALILTKLDVLDSFDVVKICHSYSLRGELLNYFPNYDQSLIEPVYQELPGWNCSTRDAKSSDDLPACALNYIKRIEDLIGVPVIMVSTSPEAEQMIVMDQSFVGRWL